MEYETPAIQQAQAEADFKDSMRGLAQHTVRVSGCNEAAHPKRFANKVDKLLSQWWADSESGQ